MEQNAVAIKLPTFWPQNPAVWFVQAESQFELRKITDEVTKYHHVVQALDQDTASRVVDLLQNQKVTYQELKSRLISTFSLTDTERATQLLAMPGLGDDRPSQLMDKMLALWPSDEKPNFMFLHLFQLQMPESIRQSLITDWDPMYPRKMASKADQLYMTLDQSVHAMKKPKKRFFARPASGFCRFHQQFGAAAYRCEQPCTFKLQGNLEADHQ